LIDIKTIACLRGLWLAGLKLPLQRGHHLCDLRLGEAPMSLEEVLDDTTGVAALQDTLVNCEPVAGKVPGPIMAVDTLALIEGAAGDVAPEGVDQGFDLGLGLLRAAVADQYGWQVLAGFFASSLPSLTSSISRASSEAWGAWQEAHRCSYSRCGSIVCAVAAAMPQHPTANSPHATLWVTHRPNTRRRNFLVRK
jgi:hypothetical protein